MKKTIENGPISDLNNSMQVLKRYFEEPNILINPNTLEFLVASNRVQFALKSDELTVDALMSTLKGEESCLQ